MPADRLTSPARVTGHAYPWDLIGDPDFIARVTDLGIDEVTLAAHYHSVRAATPQHPGHQVVTAAHAAFHRPVRPEVWADRRLAPVPAEWIDDPDSFATTAQAIREAGMRVNAWIVFTHNTRLGSEHPDLAVVNCFGDRYPYALCPQQEEVRDYSATSGGRSPARRRHRWRSDRGVGATRGPPQRAPREDRRRVGTGRGAPAVGVLLWGVPRRVVGLRPRR